MKHLKRIPTIVLPALLVLAGSVAALAGVYLLLGLAAALITGGVAGVAAGLLVDVD